MKKKEFSMSEEPEISVLWRLFHSFSK